VAVPSPPVCGLFLLEGMVTRAPVRGPPVYSVHRQLGRLNPGSRSYVTALP